MRKMILFAALALGACGPRPQSCPPPPTKLEPVKVFVDHPVACIDAKKWNSLKEPAHIASELNGNSSHDLDITGASASDLRQWGLSLKALGDPCINP